MGIKIIDYLSKIAGIKLPLTPNIGTLDFIRKNNLEYKINPAISFAYISAAKTYEQELNKGEGKLTKEQRINILKKIAITYEILYFFDCSDNVHTLQINANKALLEESSNN